MIATVDCRKRIQQSRRRVAHWIRMARRSEIEEQRRAPSVVRVNIEEVEE